MTTSESNYVTGRSPNEPTGWVGWIAFASIMMILGGGLSMIFGFVAAINDDWVAFTHTTAVLLDTSAWGWLHVAVGFVVLLCGFGVATGNMLARIVGVILAGLSLLANFLIIPLFPLWAITIIVIDALVIWALTVHGSEVKEV